MRGMSGFSLYYLVGREEIKIKVDNSIFNLYNRLTGKQYAYKSPWSMHP